VLREDHHGGSKDIRVRPSQERDPMPDLTRVAQPAARLGRPVPIRPYPTLNAAIRTIGRHAPLDTALSALPAILLESLRHG
jgi:hypothetical protein